MTHPDMFDSIRARQEAIAAAHIIGKPAERI
jgi:hypothetical protein